MATFVPGKRFCTASAIICAEECQKASFPSASSNLYNFISASEFIGRVASHVSPLTPTATTYFANLLLILSAISKPVIPSLYSFFAPSGNVIFIIFFKYFCKYTLNFLFLNLYKILNFAYFY